MEAFIETVFDNRFSNCLSWKHSRMSSRCCCLARSSWALRGARWA
jgi:hypothetical protein